MEYFKGCFLYLFMVKQILFSGLNTKHRPFLRNGENLLKVKDLLENCRVTAMDLLDSIATRTVCTLLYLSLPYLTVLYTICLNHGEVLDQ